jgi:hypothetical protein
MVITRLEFPPETGVHPTPGNLCCIEYIRQIDPNIYWVRVRAIELHQFSRWHTAIFMQEQLIQTLQLEESLYLASKRIVAPYQPALTARNHEFLGGFLVHVLCSLERDSYLVHTMSVIYNFEGGPQKMALSRDQLTCVLPVPEW